jgi:hypothetical protein
MSVYYVLNGALKQLSLNDMEQLLNCFRYPNNALDALYDLENEWSDQPQLQDPKLYDLQKIAYKQQYGSDAALDSSKEEDITP